MSQENEPNSSEAYFASELPTEEVKEEYTIRLNAEGQKHLVKLIENLTQRLLPSNATCPGKTNSQFRRNSLIEPLAPR